jgi:predicted amidohydrolase YtcJ
MIRKGYTADFTVFDQDIFEIEHDELLNTKVVLTVIDNDIMYKYE